MEHPNQPIWTDNEIIEAFRRGGKWTSLAWEYVTKKWKGVYISVIKQRAKLSFVDEDEVYEALHTMAPTFLNKVRDQNWTGPTYQLSTYFANSVYYAWLDIQRKRNKFTLPGDENLPEPEFQNTGPSEELLEILDKMLQQLNRRCQELLHMVYWEGYSNEEIAIHFGLHVQTIKNRLTRCRKNLKVLIEKLLKP